MRAVDARPGLPGHLHQRPPPVRQEPADRAGRPVVHPLAAEVEEVAHLGGDESRPRPHQTLSLVPLRTSTASSPSPGVDEGAGCGQTGRPGRARGRSRGPR